MHRATRLLVLLAVTLLSNCGTGVFTHRFEISLSDPGGRLGPPPVEMSIFNPQMGRSEEWARKTAGTAAPGIPFVAGYETVETKMVLDSSPSPRVAAAVWLPAYEQAGYFNVVLEPRAGQETTITLPFAPWSDNYPEGAKVMPLTARVSAEDSTRGSWNLKMTILIP